MFTDIKKYGVVGDGVTDNSQSISDAIRESTSNGGGTIYFPAGTYVTGPIVLQSNLTLYLDNGATLLFKDDFDAYSPVQTRWSGYECHAFSPLLYGNGLHNVTIKGEGTIDGQGKAWWDKANVLKKGGIVSTENTEILRSLNEHITETKGTNILEWDSQFLRPPLLQLYDCEHVTIEGVTLQNSPFWNTHLVYCNHVSVRGVTIKNPSDTPNGDGFDIDSCTNVRVTDCHFDVGDDCLCLKSGINESGRKVGRPTENVTVTNCTMARGHGGIVFGSENSGGIQNVTVSNCVFIGTDRGIRFKTNRARGAYIRNILITNIYMEDVFCPLAINSFYKYGVDLNDPFMNLQEPIPITEKTPKIEQISISHITAKRCRAAAGFIYGLPEMPIEDLSLSHSTIEMTTDPEEQGGEPDMVKEEIIRAGAGMFCKYVKGMEIHNVRIETRQGPALEMENVEDVDIENLKMKKKHSNTPVCTLRQVKEVYLSGRTINTTNQELHLDESSKGYVRFEGTILN